MAYTRKQLAEAWSHEDKTENGPSRKIFVELLANAKSNKPLNYAESEYLCNGLKFSALGDGSPNDFKLCDEYTFVLLYLTYVFDLHGVTQLRNYLKQVITVTQKQLDVQSLDKFSEEWEKVILKSNHPKQALNYLAKETRADIKELERQPEFHEYGFLRRCNHFEFRKKKILLHSKFIYCKYQEVFEEIAELDRRFKIDGRDIEFSEYSYVHILSRHFAEIVKQTPNNKSYHIPDFSPNEIVSQLSTVFKHIDTSGILAGASIDKITFRFKGRIYRIWINERIKSVKGVGNVKYNRLETFYPLELEADLKQLAETHEEIVINADLNVFKALPPV